MLYNGAGKNWICFLLLWWTEATLILFASIEWIQSDGYDSKAALQLLNKWLFPFHCWKINKRNEKGFKFVSNFPNRKMGQWSVKLASTWKASWHPTAGDCIIFSFRFAFKWKINTRAGPKTRQQLIGPEKNEPGTAKQAQFPA